MNSIARVGKLLAGKRILQNSARLTSSSSSLPKKINPYRYSLPERPYTMDDAMEPYGSYKTAFQAEKKAGNIALARGFIALSATITLLYYVGIFDDLFMPNLDNIMEETEPFSYDKEGRISV